MATELSGVLAWASQGRRPALPRRTAAEGLPHTSLLSLNQVGKNSAHFVHLQQGDAYPERRVPRRQEILGRQLQSSCCAEQYTASGYIRPVEAMEGIHVPEAPTDGASAPSSHQEAPYWITACTGTCHCKESFKSCSALGIYTGRHAMPVPVPGAQSLLELRQP